MNRETKIEKMIVDDKPTKFASLGWRCIYTTICWLILGNTISADRSFLVSLFIFSMPLFMDYLKFIPVRKGWRMAIRKLGIILSGTWLSIGLLGLFDIIRMCGIDDEVFFQVSNNFIVLKGYLVAAKHIWCLIGVSVFFTLIDYVAYEKPMYKKIKNKS
ncbi:hypothetical protein PV797_14160 [Clostridiaceae bacterium M8S5]|nr:hypothetical protein PV797_14160 [Clostridiaceae bacterium M8S5]